MAQVSRDVTDYQKVTLDLNTVRTDTLLNVTGKSFVVLKNQGTWSLKLVRISGTDGDVLDSTELTTGTGVGVDFTNIKFTNTSQAGNEVRLLIEK